MFVNNEEYINNNVSKKYECGEIIGNYLIKMGIPLLFKKDSKMYFSKTQRLQRVLDSIPFYLKALMKVGVING